MPPRQGAKAIAQQHAAATAQAQAAAAAARGRGSRQLTASVAVAPPPPLPPPLRAAGGLDAAAALWPLAGALIAVRSTPCSAPLRASHPDAHLSRALLDTRARRLTHAYLERRGRCCVVGRRVRARFQRGCGAAQRAAWLRVWRRWRRRRRRWAARWATWRVTWRARGPSCGSPRATPQPPDAPRRSSCSAPRRRSSSCKARGTTQVAALLTRF
jgi:hypothetical protein